MQNTNYFSLTPSFIFKEVYCFILNPVIKKRNDEYDKKNNSCYLYTGF